MIPIPAKLAAAGVTDMVRVTDARMSGTSFGTVFLHAAPEAAVGGPLALVRDGDMISVDAAAGSISLEVADGRAGPAPGRVGTAGLAAPARLAGPVPRPRAAGTQGCDLDFLARTDGSPPQVRRAGGREVLTSMIHMLNVIEGRKP